MAAVEDRLDYPLGIIVDVPVASLKQNPWNPRVISDEMLESLMQSMSHDEEGLRDRPCIALPDGTVIAGNQRLKSATALGWETIPTVFRDYDQIRARTVALRDNNPWGEWDDPVLAEILRELEDEGVNLELTGFTVDRLESLRSLSPEPPGDDPGPDRGGSLKISDVTIGDPTNVVADGDVWQLGHHRLVCTPPWSGWKNYVPLLLENDDQLLLLYPTPTVPLTNKAKETPMVLVQPDPWLAGHLVDKYQAVHGNDETVKRIHPAEAETETESA